MLTHLQLRSFKAWEYTGDLRLAPLTLLFGAYSAGKSSLGQSLLLKQAVLAASTVSSIWAALPTACTGTSCGLT